MKWTNLENVFKTEPTYRLKQAKQVIFDQLAESWSAATVFSKEWREKLTQTFPLLIEADVLTTPDGQTEKAILTLGNGAKIETVLMRYPQRNTVCVSSQVGCPLGCVFCATGKMGFSRNLTDWEIVAQVLFFARRLRQENQRVTNIVFMGMGEPLLNDEPVMNAIRLLHDPEGLGLGARRFSISTAGIPEGIRRLAQQPLEINLALSLHAPNDTLRSRLMPVNRQHPLKEVLAAIDEYLETTRRKVLFEYLMIRDVNDTPKLARELARLAKNRLATVNLIPYNPTGVFTASTPTRIQKFRAVLEKTGVGVTQRYKFGQKIKAACGQLATTGPSGHV